MSRGLSEMIDVAKQWLLDSTQVQHFDNATLSTAQAQAAALIAIAEQMKIRNDREEAARKQVAGEV